MHPPVCPNLRSTALPTWLRRPSASVRVRPAGHPTYYYVLSIYPFHPVPIFRPGAIQPLPLPNWNHISSQHGDAGGVESSGSVGRPGSAHSPAGGRTREEGRLEFFFLPSPFPDGASYPSSSSSIPSCSTVYLPRVGCVHPSGEGGERIPMGEEISC